MRAVCNTAEILEISCGDDGGVLIIKVRDSGWLMQLLSVLLEAPEAAWCSGRLSVRGCRWLCIGWDTRGLAGSVDEVDTEVTACVT